VRMSQPMATTVSKCVETQTGTPSRRAQVLHTPVEMGNQDIGPEVVHDRLVNTLNTVRNGVRKVGRNVRVTLHGELPDSNPSDHDSDAGPLDDPRRDTPPHVWRRTLEARGHLPSGHMLSSL
jgi:hypothetical protein